MVSEYLLNYLARPPRTEAEARKQLGRPAPEVAAAVKTGKVVVLATWRKAA